MVAPWNDRIRRGTEKAVKIHHVTPLGLLNEWDTNDFPTTLPEISSPIELKCVSENGKTTLKPKWKLSHFFQEMELNQMLKEYKTGHLCFIGNAGSGKSTLMKSIARNFRKYPDLLHVEIVIFIKCDELNTEKSASNILSLCSHHSDLDEDDLDKFDRYCQEHPKGVLFMVDGLDNLPRYFEKTEKSKKNRACNLVKELMDGSRYPRCKIISSSRSYVELGQSKQCYNSMVFIHGFSEASIISIISHYFRPSADDVILFFTQNPLLMELCKTPLFLMFTLIAKNQYPDFSPTTKTEILLFLFYNILQSDSNPKFKEATWLKIGKMCFDMLEGDQSYFTVAELRDCGLNSEERDELTQSMLVEGSRQFYFAHQSLTDLLTALYIMKCGINKFNRVIKLLKLPQFEMVECMLSGMTLNKDISKRLPGVSEGPDFEEKRKAIEEYLLERCKDLQNISDYLLSKRTTLSLYEAGSGRENIVRKKVESIVFDFHPLLSILSLGDISLVRAIGSVAASANTLQELTVRGLFWMDGDVDILLSSIFKKCPTIKKIDLSDSFLDEEALFTIGEVSRLCKVENLAIACNIWLDYVDNQTLRNLKRGLRDHKLKTLNLSYGLEELTERELYLEEEPEPIKVVYQLDQKKSGNLTFPIFASEITKKFPNPGKCKTASYDFIHSVTTLFGNVEHEIYLYCWKIPKHQMTLLRKQLCDTESLGLVVHLCSDLKLANNCMKADASYAKVSGTPVDNPPIPSSPPQESISKVASPTKPCTADQEKPACCVTNSQDTIEEANIESRMSEEQKSLIVFVQNEYLHPNEIFRTLEKLADLEYIHELKFYDCSVKSGVAQVLEEMKKSQKKVSNLCVCATKNVDELASDIYDFIKSCVVEGLSVEDCDQVENFMNILLSQLQSSEIPSFRKINISYVKNLSNYSVLRDVISGRIEELKMMNCDLDTEKIEQLCMECTNGKISVLDVSFNTELVAEDIAMLGKLLQKGSVKELSLRGCDLSEEDFEGFQSPSFEGKQVQLLDLGYNEGMESEDFEALAKAVNTLKVQKLSLRFCKIDAYHLDSLMGSLENELIYLDLRGNANIGCCIPQLLGILDAVKAIDISDCKLTHVDIENLAKKLQVTKRRLSALNISDSKRQMNEFFFKAVCDLMPYVDDNLVLCCPNVGSFRCKLHRALKDLPGKSLKIETEESSFSPSMTKHWTWA